MFCGHHTGLELLNQARVVPFGHTRLFIDDVQFRDFIAGFRNGLQYL